VHAQTLRTAMGGEAPQEALRPVTMILVLLAALPFLLRDWRWALAVALLAATAIAAGALFSLRSGLFVPVSAPLLTVLLAWGVRAFLALRTGPAGAPNIQHSS
jgi:hypothetical protein